jgi:hypothetical protein
MVCIFNRIYIYKSVVTTGRHVSAETVQVAALVLETFPSRSSSAPSSVTYIADLPPSLTNRPYCAHIVLFAGAWQ